MRKRRQSRTEIWVVPAALACAATTAGVRADPPVAAPVCAYPHPLITEVLYAVPSVGEADANKDGKRSVSGDEFIEIVNPHEKSIDLRGYTITDGSPNSKSQVKFVFPSIVVPARGVVVVFNGHDAKIPGPVGNAKRAPATTSEQFGRSAVFSMGVKSSRTALSNAGDAVCLRAPGGTCVQRIRWGKADETAGGTGFALDEVAPMTSDGSVQREGIGRNATWKAHAEGGGAAFSPGVFAIAAAPDAAAAKPTIPAKPAPPEKAPEPAPSIEPSEPSPAEPPAPRAKKPSGAPKF